MGLLRRRSFLAGGLPALAGSAASYRERLLAAHRAAAAGRFNERGGWIDPEPSEGPAYGNSTRTQLWQVWPLLAGSARERQIANRVIRAQDYSKARPDPFVAYAAADFLNRFAGSLDPDSRRILAAYLEPTLAASTQRGVPAQNINHPLMWMGALLLGGQALDRREYRQAGAHMFGEFARLISTVGCPSEFNSPTYTPISMSCLAQIAASAGDRALSAAARAIEQRFWLTQAGFWHAATGLPAGPFSRAYAADSTGQASNMQLLWYLVLGDAVLLNPLEHVYKADPHLDYHQGGRVFLQGQYAAIAQADYEPPPMLSRLAAGRRLPATVRSSTFVGDFQESGSGIWYRGGRRALTCYQHPAYSLGTASQMYANGNQTDNLSATWLIHSPRKPSNVRTLFARYTQEGELPGAHGSTFLADRGRSVTAQHANRAVLVGNPKVQPWSGVSGFRQSVLLPEHFSLVEAIVVDGRTLSALPYEGPWPEWVVLLDGACRIALHPLGAPLNSGSNLCRIERVNRYLAVHFYGYRGPARDFAPAECAGLPSGFFLELSTANDDRAELSGITVTDRVVGNRREVLCRGQNFSLEVVYNALHDDLVRTVPAFDGEFFESPEIRGGLKEMKLGEFEIEPEQDRLYWAALDPQGELWIYPQQAAEGGFVARRGGVIRRLAPRGLEPVRWR